MIAALQSALSPGRPLAFLDNDIMPTVLPDASKCFVKSEIPIEARRVGYCAWGCFSIFWFEPATARRLSCKKRAACKGGPFVSFCYSGLSAACLRGGSRAPESWISATWWSLKPSTWRRISSVCSPSSGERVDLARAIRQLDRVADREVLAAGRGGRPRPRCRWRAATGLRPVPSSTGSGRRGCRPC